MHGLVIHDIKEVEGVRQQEEQEDKRDEEIGDEVKGEVEEVARGCATTGASSSQYRNCGGSAVAVF